MAYFSGYSHSPDYYKAGGYICPSDIFYGRPKRAVNTYGKWKVILSHQNSGLKYCYVQVIVNLPDEYYAQGYGAGYEAYTQVCCNDQVKYSILIDLH